MGGCAPIIKITSRAVLTVMIFLPDRAELMTGAIVQEPAALKMLK